MFPNKLHFDQITTKQHGTAEYSLASYVWSMMRFHLEKLINWFSFSLTTLVLNKCNHLKKTAHNQTHCVHCVLLCVCLFKPNYRHDRSGCSCFFPSDRRFAKVWCEQRCAESRDEAGPEGKARVRGLSFMSHGSVIIEAESSPISHTD